MEYGQALEMMKRCREEIISLRKVVDNLRPKADAYDRISHVLSLLPQRSTAMSEDVVWIIDREMRNLADKKETTEPVDEDDGNTPVGIIGGVS